MDIIYFNLCRKRNLILSLITGFKSVALILELLGNQILADKEKEELLHLILSTVLQMNNGFINIEGNLNYLMSALMDLKFYSWRSQKNLIKIKKKKNLTLTPMLQSSLKEYHID